MAPFIPFPCRHNMFYRVDFVDGVSGIPSWMGICSISGAYSQSKSYAETLAGQRREPSWMV